MKFIFIQALHYRKNKPIPFRISIGDAEAEDPLYFIFRPEMTLPLSIYKVHQLDPQEFLSAPSFRDLADELIELLKGEQLVFMDRMQFLILKSLFKSIGYNFNVIPKILRHGSTHTSTPLPLSNRDKPLKASVAYGKQEVKTMQDMLLGISENSVARASETSRRTVDLSIYKPAPGVYFFLDAHDHVIYVGKAKNIRKRLHSHFSNRLRGNTMDYSQVCAITVEYAGHDFIAQLLESHYIKTLQPKYNTQQVRDAAPYLIEKGATAKGIHRLKITRKAVKDSWPEQHFNRTSVKQTLEVFCTTYQLCRKHCGLETIKGPCSNVTLHQQACVCNGDEHIAAYNKRFDIAYNDFQSKKSRKLYKLKGRTAHEDAFIYIVNGIYEGYGFIPKTATIRTEADILGYLKVMGSNYDTSRIINLLPRHVLKEAILELAPDF